VAVRAVFSLVATYRPAAAEPAEGQIEADLESLMCVIVNLVKEKRLLRSGLPILLGLEEDADVSSDTPHLFSAPDKQSPTLADMCKTIFG